jgi:hypothetical protein
LCSSSFPMRAGYCIKLYSHLQCSLVWSRLNQNYASLLRDSLPLYALTCPAPFADVAFDGTDYLRGASVAQCRILQQVQVLARRKEKALHHNSALSASKRALLISKLSSVSFTPSPLCIAVHSDIHRAETERNVNEASILSQS